MCPAADEFTSVDCTGDGAGCKDLLYWKLGDLLAMPFI
jgi:hypothetical protein